MIINVVGGQWGSEAKGLAVETLAKENIIDIAVRTGALNAGHTVYNTDQDKYAMQLLPCAWVNPRVRLVLGAGAFLNQEHLERELQWLREAGKDGEPRLLADHRCGLHKADHASGEKGMHERMGSTGKGCMEAFQAKQRRNPDETPLFFDQHPEYRDRFVVTDTERYLNDAYDAGKVILLEGTQGTMLDFHLADWPYVTARQTFASAWMTEAGLSHRLDSRVVLVLRTFPIRVAGNSGPLPGEIGWNELAREMLKAGEDRFTLEDVQAFEEMETQVASELGMPAVPAHKLDEKQRAQFSAELSELHAMVFDKLPPEVSERLRLFFETTTVTKKLRRIAELEELYLIKTLRINRPDIIFMNFLNYKFPETWGMKTWAELPDKAKNWVRDFEREYNTPIGWLSTSPTDVIQVPNSRAKFINNLNK